MVKGRQQQFTLKQTCHFNPKLKRYSSSSRTGQSLIPRSPRGHVCSETLAAFIHANTIKLRDLKTADRNKASQDLGTHGDLRLLPKTVLVGFPVAFHQPQTTVKTWSFMAQK